MRLLRIVLIYLVTLSIVVACGGGGGGSTTTATSSNTTVNLSCTAASVTTCTTAMNGKPVDGGLVQTTCSELLSGGDVEFSYSLGTSEGSESVTCTADGCSMSSSKWHVNSESGNTAATNLTAGTYTFAVFVDSDPEDDSDGPGPGDLLFCKEGIVLTSARNTFSVGNDSYIDPASFGGESAISLSIACTTTGSGNCSNAVTPSPFVGGAFVADKTCANVFDVDFMSSYDIDDSVPASCGVDSCSYAIDTLYVEGSEENEVAAGSYAFVAFFDTDGNDSDFPDASDVTFCKEFTLSTDGEISDFEIADADIIPTPSAPARAFAFDISCTSTGDGNCSNGGAAGASPEIQGGLAYGETCATLSGGGPSVRFKDGVTNILA